MICVDARLAVKWVLEEDDSPQARRLYRRTTRAGDRIIGPPLLPIEVTNIVRQRMRRTALSRTDALAALDGFLAFPIGIHDPGGLHRLALLMADDYALAAAYDVHYLSLAETYGCDLWTADQRLVAALGGRLPFVRSLDELSP